MSLRSLVAFLFLTFLSANVFAEEQTLLSFNYLLRANRNYETGLYEVRSAPAQVDFLKLTQGGSSYCNIYVSKVFYTTEPGGTLHTAPPVTESGNNLYKIEGAKVWAVNVNFTQRVWNNVNCNLTVTGIENSSPEPDPWDNWDQVATIDIAEEWGREIRTVGPFTIDDSIEGFRLVIPRVCGNVLLDSALVKALGEREEYSESDFLLLQNNEQKTYTHKFREATTTHSLSFRIKPRGESCQVAVEVIYY